MLADAVVLLDLGLPMVAGPSRTSKALPIAEHLTSGRVLNDERTEAKAGSCCGA